MSYNDDYYKNAWEKQNQSASQNKPFSYDNYPLYNPNDEDASSLHGQWENYIFGDWSSNNGSSSSGNGGSYGGGYGNAYQKQLDAIRNQQQTEEQRLRDQSANLIRQYEAQKPVLKQRFTDNAQDAYVQKMNTLKEMPQVLSAQGYTGGLSESSNIKVDNQYGNAYNAHQRDYNEGLSGVDNQISNANASLNDMLAQNSINYSGLISNAEMSYQQMLMQAQRDEQAQKLQEQVRLQEEKKWQQQFEYQKEQDRLANELAKQKFVAANAPKNTGGGTYKAVADPDFGDDEGSGDPTASGNGTPASTPSKVAQTWYNYIKKFAGNDLDKVDDTINSFVQDGRLTQKTAMEILSMF